jgi:RNA methyltransferase, TrmH family
MVSRHLISLQHPLVKRLVKLRESRSFRQEEGEVLIVGEQLVRDVAAARQLKILISTKPLNVSAEESFVSSAEVLKKITATDAVVAATLPLPPSTSLCHTNRIVVLEGLQDPGNVGTILRTALALGWDGAFLTPTTADPFNDKALRAARGAPLFLPIQSGTLEDLQTLLQENQMNAYIADVHGKNLSEVAFKPPLALILGHETEGPSPLAKTFGQTLAIPMHKTMESLNVASAAAIFMYQLQTQSRI